MSPKPCEMCADLNSRDLDWHSHRHGQWQRKASQWQRKASQCQSGGCKILLEAVSKFFPGMSFNEFVCLVPGKGLIQIGLGHDEVHIQLFVTEGMCSTSQAHTIAQVSPGERHPVWSNVSRSVCYQDLSSDQSLAFVHSQLARCIDEHPGCQTPPTERAYMPTRILDLGMIGDSATDISSRTGVQLVESDGLAGERKYACLSYRWDSNNLTTTRATYEQHREGIAFKDLTLAFQDTVHIVRRLGVRYLWIDSLCIVQDDEEDWRAESKTMATVYSRALFTLARHVDSTTSLKSLSQMQIHIVSDPSVLPPVYARLQPKHIWDILGSEQRPLLKRGWVFQERLLSPRVIHFTDFEIIWECHEVSQCQCASTGSFMMTPKISHARALGLTDHTAIVNEAAIRERWRSIIQEYSWLDLTKLSDRLPAIQGCAEQIRPHLQDSYSFGLWTKSSGRDLSWYHSHVRPERRPIELFHVPTWSWASVSGLVHYGFRLVRSEAVIEHVQDDSCQGQTSAYWLITGQIMPARLKLGVDPFAGDRCVYSWAARGIEIEVAGDYLVGGISVCLMSNKYRFYPDFALRGDDWDNESWYDITIVRMTEDITGDDDLVLWRYGKAIPGSGQERKTKEGYPIYQRVGCLQENLFFERGIVDWSKVNRVTIALE
jgi:hypothetical protein